MTAATTQSIEALISRIDRAAQRFVAAHAALGKVGRTKKRPHPPCPPSTQRRPANVLAFRVAQLPNEAQASQTKSKL